jgi:hypothetical protein
VVDRKGAQVVARLEVAGDLRHHLLGHLSVGLVLEVDDLPAPRLPPHGAREGGDRAGALVRDLRCDGLQRERLLGDTEGAARDRRDQRDLVAVAQLAAAVGVLAVDGVEQPLGLLAEPEGGPHVAHPCDALDRTPAPPGALAQAREQAHLDVHRA